MLIFFMRQYMRKMALVVTATILLCWWIYPETWNWLEAISYLGGFESWDMGIENDLACLLFMSGFVLAGLMCLDMGRDYFKGNYYNGDLKGWTCMIMGIGSMMLAIPHDSGSPLHAIGATMYVLGFTFLNFIMQVFKGRKEEFTLDKALDYTIAIIIVIFCILFLTSVVFDPHIKYIFEKLIVFVAVISSAFLDEDDA